MDDVSQRRPGIPLGRVAGVPVYLAPSWFVIALVVVVVFSPQVERALGPGGARSYVVALVYAVLLLVSVLVHEFAHALAARAYGLPVHEVVATLMGGHTQFEDESPTPGRSAVVAVVGPLANAVLALVGLAALQVLTDPVGRLLVAALVFSNGFVALFNLAPGLPLDGGRVVESLVWRLTGRRETGTVVAGWSGRVIAVALVALTLGPTLLSGGRPSLVSVVWVAMIAALLWQGAGAALSVAKVRRRAAGLSLQSFSAPAVAAPLGTDDWRRAAPGLDLVALDGERRPVGLLRAADADRWRAPDGAPAGTPLSALMSVLDPVVVLPGGATREQVLQALAARPAHTYVVVDGAGRVVGTAEGDRLAGAVTGRT
jgi:Zn-dependent protease